VGMEMEMETSPPVMPSIREEEAPESQIKTTRILDTERWAAMCGLGTSNFVLGHHKA